MQFGEKFELEVVVEARRQCRDEMIDWCDRHIRVQSRWYAGTDQEKYEVLAGARRLYNPDERANIRGRRRRSPDQIARAEGFTRFRYRRVPAGDSGDVVVVK